MPANIAANGASAAFEAGGSVAPGPLAYLDAALGRASAGHGTPITIGLAVVEAGLGAGIMHDKWRNTAAVTGAAFAFAVWATAQGLGGLATGQATDPNSGPLLIVLSAAVYMPAALQSHHTAKRGITNEEKAPPGHAGGPVPGRSTRPLRADSRGRFSC
jgi:hypothetical protein